MTLNKNNNPQNDRLKMLSFNIQVGIDTQRYSDYFRKSWRHFLPHAGRHLNLSRIAKLVKDYDVVALQEVDAGATRMTSSATAARLPTSAPRIISRR